MTLWAESTAGMHNLFRLSSLASLEGYYHKPRFDRELLERYGTGLIGTTGCPSGEVNRWLQAGNYDRALAAAADFRDILGAGNYFCEVMDHGLAIERRFREDLLRIARALDLPLIATNDLHYVHASDADTHDVLLCIGTRTTMDDPKRFRFDARDFYVKSARRDAPGLGGAARGVRQHPAHRRALPRRVQRGRQPHAGLPGAGGGERGVLAGQGGRASACSTGTRAPFPTTSGAQAEYEVGVIIQMGFPGLLPRHRRPRAPREGERHPGRPGPWVRGRRDDRLRARHHRARPDEARPAVRAVPQPRAHLDARHRHGLRRAPSRRHDPLRHREVRRGARRADHHVRLHQGQGGGQGQRPRARPPLRPRRPHHQGDAAVGHGQGHLARGRLRPEERPLRRGGRVPRAVRGRARRPRRSSTPRRASRA